MCEYCSLNKDFWNQVVEGSKRITILTPEQVEQLYRDNPQLQKVADDA
jgi:hypothetical protein